MGLHRSTVRLLEDDSLCKRVREAVSRNYSKKYIMEQYKLTRDQLDHILKMNITRPPYSGGMNINK